MYPTKILTKFLRIALFTLGFFVLFSQTSALQAAEAWKIKSFDSQITIENEGTVLVKETLEVDFGELEKRGIFREIPVTYQNNDRTNLFTRIDIVEILQDGSAATYTQSIESGTITFKIGDSNRKITGLHTYVITYRATGILGSFEENDFLYWNVTGNQWEVPIEAASARVDLPKSGVADSACYAGKSGSDKACESTNEQPTFVSFKQTSTLNPGEGLTVAVGYTKGMVPLLTVPEAQSLETGIEYSNGSLGLGFFSFIIALMLGLLFTYRQWSQQGRDSVRESRLNYIITPEYEPPLKLRPAEIGCVIDEKADTIDISASIVDLAVRGYLTITEIPKKGFLGKVDYKLEKLDIPETELREYEKKLLEALFAGKQEVLISSLKNSFYEDLEEIKGMVYEEVTKQAFFVKNPDAVRKLWVGINGGVFIGSIVVLVFLFEFIKNDYLNMLFLGLMLAVIFTALVRILITKAMPGRTKKGVETYQKILGYKRFLSATEKYRQPYFESQNFFMDVLPYAMVFGVTKKLAKSFEVMGIVPQNPSWYVGQSAFNVMIFGNAMQDFSNNLNSTMASAPSGSGTSGGFSGGGFGGGGGGSW